MFFSAISNASGISPYADKVGIDVIEKFNISHDIQPHTSTLFGEQIDASFGDVNFAQIDLDIPGNNGLPVNITRTLSGPDNWFADSREFASWSLSLPHIRTSLIGDPLTGAIPQRGGWALNTACSSHTGPGRYRLKVGTSTAEVLESDYWGGDTISIPNQGSFKILTDSQNIKKTVNGWKVDCYIKSNGQEGFKVTDSHANTYYFGTVKRVKSLRNLEVSPSKPISNCSGLGGGRPCNPIEIPNNDSFKVALVKYSVFMMVDKVEDRHGNFVSYTYENDKLVNINSSDNRNIAISYIGNYISKITSGEKTYSYEYEDLQGLKLKKVTLPGGKFWDYYYPKQGEEGSNFWDSFKLGEHTQVPMGSGCQVTGIGGLYIRMRHPDGAIGEFHMRETYHGRTEIDKIPRPNPDFWPQDLVGYYDANCFSMFSIQKKVITHLNGESDKWLYTYSSNDGAYKNEVKESVKNINLDFSFIDVSPGDIKTTKIYHPDGSYGVKYISRKVGWNENKLIAEDLYSLDGRIIKRDEYFLEKGRYIGTSNVYLDSSSSQKILNRKVRSKFYHEDSTVDNYIYEVNRFNLYDEPEIEIFSDLSENNPKWTKTAFYHNQTINLLNVKVGTLISDDGANWRDVSKLELYTSGKAIGLPSRSWVAGKLISNNTYHSDGNLLQTTYVDSGRYEKFENYYRGKARKITIPCATTNGCNTANGSTSNTIIALLEVNSDGTTKSVTDFNGNKTSYTYNPIGWLTKIDYADPRWADKVISYAVVSSLGDGVGGSDVAVGSLRQTISQGNYEKRIYHDGLLRPILTLERDISNPSTTRYQSFAYDHDNRQTLASFPSADASNRIGMETEYDALGRVITQTRTSDGSVSRREYLSGNKVAVTDGENNTTTTTYLAYGEPSFDKPTLIEAPDTDDVAIDYNVFDQVTSIRQGNVTETRIYDAYQQLCKQVRPETGISAFGYNGQRQQIWRAEGTNGSTTACDASAVPTTHKVVLSYDNLGQLRTENFPDSTPDKTYSYDANGNLISLLAGPANWSYLYNSQSGLEKETLSLDGRNFVLDWEYNNLGALSTLKYPSGAVVDFAPNALGQPTKAGSYATGVSYHPNGQIKQFTYGNGIVRKVALDTTGRIDAITDAKAGSVKNNLDPSYDYNDNLSRLIDWVDRNNDVDNLVYDGVDRLTSADGKWGTGRYSYDGLGNVLSRSLNNSTISYKYNALNRLNNLTGAYAYGYQYDARGNVTNNGRYSLAYNLGQQMTAAKGINYVYDGHNRRVKQTKTDGSHYTVYGQGGQLLHRQAADGTKTDSVYLGKTLVAEVGGSTLYQHTDMLGSVVSESDASGNIISRSHYEPFGKRIGGDKEGIGYTGHLQDKDLGLTYMQARYYDPLIGRFYSNDPIGFRDVHSFNRYAYANNNPYKYIDPDGKWAIPLIFGLEELGKAALVTAGVIGTGAGIEQTIIAVSESGNKSVDDRINGVKEGKEPAAGEAGKKGQLEGAGGKEGSKADLDSLGVVEGTEWSSEDGSRQGGTLEDGSKVNVHPSSGGDSYPKGTPTLQIDRPSGKADVKIRYPEDK